MTPADMSKLVKILQRLKAIESKSKGIRGEERCQIAAIED